MRKMMIVFCLIVLLLIFTLGLNSTSTKAVTKKTVFIDPGHGGKDGGAIINEVEEADLNLSIAMKLKNIFENNGFDVLMTRDGDYDLASDPNNRKRTDLRKRAELINQSNCVLYLSIHMNSFTNSSYKGAQVFYGTSNKNNSLLAKNIQDSLTSLLQNSTRKEKALKDVYLVDHVNKVGCLIECGFLSNSQELKLLCSDDYQTKVAFAIYYGAKFYLDIA